MGKVSVIIPNDKPERPRGEKRTALVLIPGSVNYFYNLCGRRLAESLRDLSFTVDVATLTDCPSQTYDWCVLSNISEVVHAYGSKEAAFEKLRALQKSCKVMTQASMECAATRWFRIIQEYCQALDIQSFLDIGLHSQWDYLTAHARATYHFLPAGLTTTEQQSLEDMDLLDEQRAIPWAFVGHLTADRAALVDYLVRNLDPRGFVYIPRLHTPCTEKGSPHLNQEQFDAVLRRTRYQLWCSHHQAFYMECERFRMSLLAGGVAVKVLSHADQSQEEIPFANLVIEEKDLAARLGSFDFQEVRQQFRDEFRRIKPFKAGLAEFLTALSLLDQHEVGSLIGSQQPMGRAA